MTTIHRLATATLIALSLTACGSATVVRQDASSGTLRLTGSYGFAAGDARSQVMDHCQGRYESAEQDGTLEYRCLRPQSLASAAR